MPSDDETRPEPYPDDFDLMKQLNRLDEAATDASRSAWMAQQHGSDNTEQRDQWIDAAGNELERAEFILEEKILAEVEDAENHG